ncbi:MAG: hypothetical protein KJN60_10105 [Boseongicola sp.]|nr:hypothetical protein [Boseongicola sp.]
MKNYPYIRAHGALMGSNAQFIEDEVAEARRLRAPKDAFTVDPIRTLRDLDGKSTIAGITCEKRPDCVDNLGSIHRSPEQAQFANRRNNATGVTGKAPMTREEAQSVVAQMRDETNVVAQRRLLKLALGPFGNLTPEAADVYRARLAQIS